MMVMIMIERWMRNRSRLEIGSAKWGDGAPRSTISFIKLIMVLLMAFKIKLKADMEPVWLWEGNDIFQKASKGSFAMRFVGTIEEIELDLQLGILVQKQCMEVGPQWAICNDLFIAMQNGLLCTTNGMRCVYVLIEYEPPQQTEVRMLGCQCCQNVQ